MIQTQTQLLHPPLPERSKDKDLSPMEEVIDRIVSDLESNTPLSPPLLLDIETFYTELASRSLPLSSLSISMDSAPLLAPDSPSLSLFTPLAFLDLLHAIRKSLKGKKATSKQDGREIVSVLQKMEKVLGFVHLGRFPDSVKSLVQTVAEIPVLLGEGCGFSREVDERLCGICASTANNDLLDSKREVQRLRKVISDHCLGQVDSGERRSPTVLIWPDDEKTVHSNGYFEHDRNFEPSKLRGEKERIEMLRREVGELKEVIEGKEFLVQSYKEQKAELGMKVKDLQHKLNSQLPNIL